MRSIYLVFEGHGLYHWPPTGRSCVTATRIEPCLTAVPFHWKTEVSGVSHRRQEESRLAKRPFRAWRKTPTGDNAHHYRIVDDKVGCSGNHVPQKGQWLSGSLGRVLPLEGRYCSVPLSRPTWVVVMCKYLVEDLELIGLPASLVLTWYCFLCCMSRSLQIFEEDHPCSRRRKPIRP